MRNLILSFCLMFLHTTNSFAACGSEFVFLAHNNTTFTDSSTQSNTVTAIGGEVISTAQKKFGAGSMLGTNDGDYIEMANIAAYRVGTGDFTIDFWVRFTSFTGGDADLANLGDGGAGGFSLQINANSLLLQINSITRKIELWSPSIDTWYHVEASRISPNIYFFIDGTQLGSGTADATAISDTTSVLQFGSNPGGSRAIHGYMDEIAYRNTGTHSANFTPPIEEYCSGGSTDKMLQVFE